MVNLRFILLFFLLMHHYVYGQRISPDSLMAMGEIHLLFDSAQLSVFDNPNNTGGCYRFYLDGVKVAFKCFYNNLSIKSEVQFDALENETGGYHFWSQVGQLEARIEYKAGEWHGIYQVWDSTGLLKEEGTMEHGRGTINKFNSEGKLYQRDFVHKSGYIYRIEGFCPDGRVEHDIHFLEELEQYVQYDCETRNIVEKGIKSSGARHGEWEYFDKEGNLIEKRLYEYGELIEEEAIEK